MSRTNWDDVERLAAQIRASLPVANNSLLAAALTSILCEKLEEIFKASPVEPSLKDIETFTAIRRLAETLVSRVR